MRIVLHLLFGISPLVFIQNCKDIKVIEVAYSYQITFGYFMEASDLLTMASSSLMNYESYVQDLLDC
jgi:hypothetical protein